MRLQDLKKPLLIALALVPIAAVGGGLVGLSGLESYPPEVQAQMLAQMGSVGGLVAASALQSALYTLVAGFFGCLLAEKTGLLRPLTFSKAILKRTVPVIVLCGLLFACDKPVFGRLLPQVADSYAAGITPAGFLAALLYGGIIEEVLLRLFVLSLLAFLLWKLFARRHPREDIPVWVFVTANLLAALLFAAGHLPATVTLFGGLTPLLVLRCFLLNGALGLFFGGLYRRYGIQYAMLGHFGCHLVSKLLLLL